MTRFAKRTWRVREVLVALLASLALGLPASAQVVFDDTYRPAGTAPTRILGGGLDYVIDEPDGLLQSGGGRSNLFFSFSRFDIPAGESASFLATSPVDSIIARVTGGTASQIDGRLRSEVPGADLFLLNPAGMLFSSTARLELPAAFYVATADSLAFADGTRFAVADVAPQVTAASPEAFGFLAGPTGEIDFDEPLPLTMANETTLTAVGGRVRIRNGGSLFVPRGTLQLAAVGEAAADVPIDLETWSTRDGDPATLGEVVIGEDVTVSLVDRANPTENQGRVVIRGGRFEIDFTRNFFAGGNNDGRPAFDIEVAGEIEIRDSVIRSIGESDNPAGGIRLVAERVHIDAAGFPGVRVQTTGAGAGGDIEIEADELVVTSGEIFTETFGPGTSGDVRIDASRVELGRDASIGSRTVGSGFVGNDSGLVDIDAETVLVRDGGQITSRTQGSGQAGGVRVVARESVTLDGDQIVVVGGAPVLRPSGIFSRSGLALDDDPAATGDGGPIRIETADLSMSGGAQVSTRTFGSGNAGQIEIVASGRVQVDGAGSLEPTTISARGFEGDGGDVSIMADSLELTRSGQIQSTTDGVGDAGIIDIDVRQLSLSGVSGSGRASRIAAETLLDGSFLQPGGAAGRIDIDVAEDVTLEDGATISARSIGRGATNDISIDAGGTIRLDSSATVSSQAEFANAVVTAGDVLLSARVSVQLRDGSSITAQSDGLGDAGNIVIVAPSIDIRESFLTTNARTALGGNILLDATNNVALFSSQATTDVGAGVGQGGDIVINGQTAVVNVSRVTANARGNADAGNIQITTSDGLLQSTNSIVEASAELGIDGRVVVQGPNTAVAGDLSQLPSSFLDAASQLEEACLARDAPSGSFEIRAIPALLAPPDELFEPFRARGAPSDESETCREPTP